MWHSIWGVQLPVNKCGLYLSGTVPVVINSQLISCLSKSVFCFGFLMALLRSFLKRLLTLIARVTGGYLSK